MNSQPQHIHLSAICSPKELALQLLKDIEEAKALEEVYQDEEVQRLTENKFTDAELDEYARLDQINQRKCKGTPHEL